MSRILLIIVALGLLGIGGAVYLFAVYLPQQQRGQAQDEVTAWEVRLAAARACLLGPSPLGGTTRESLAIRELSPDPWNRGSCTTLIGKLSRGEAEDTGMAAVEEAWRGVDRAAGVVAAAFLAHVDPAGEPAANRRPEALPEALEALDRAHATLRGEAGMAAPSTRASAALPRADVQPLQAGAERVTELESWTMPSMSSVVAFGRTKAGEVQILLAPGAAPATQPVAPSVLRTLPDAPWGAGGLALPGATGAGLYQIVVGALDGRGALIRPAIPDAAAAARAADAVTVDGNPRVFAVTGTADDGLVVAGGRSSLVLVRSKAGKLAPEKPIAIGQLAFAVDPTGRALVAYNDADGALHGFITRGGAPAPALSLGATVADGACLTGTRGWIAGEGSDEIISFDDTGGVPHTYARHDLLGCTADAALLHKRGAAHYVVCAAECRVAVLNGMRPSRVGTLAGTQVAALVARDQVLGVWSEGAPPAYYALPHKLEPKFALSDGKVIDVIATTADGLVIARVPVK